MSVTCKQCGEAVNEADPFCSECGAPLTNQQEESGRDNLLIPAGNQEPEVTDQALAADQALNSVHTTSGSSAEPTGALLEESPADSEPISDCEQFDLRWNRGASMFLAGTGTSLEFEVSPRVTREKCSDFRLLVKAPGEVSFSEHPLRFVSINRPVTVNVNFRPTSQHVGVHQTIDLIFTYKSRGRRQWFAAQLPVDIYPANESSEKIIENVNITIDSITQEGKAGESQLNMLSNLSSSAHSSDELLRQIKESGVLWVDLPMIRSKAVTASRISRDSAGRESGGSLFSAKNITIAAVVINLIIFGVKLYLDGKEANEPISGQDAPEQTTQEQIVQVAPAPQSEAVVTRSLQVNRTNDAAEPDGIDDKSVAEDATANVVKHEDEPLRQEPLMQDSQNQNIIKVERPLPAQDITQSENMPSIAKAELKSMDGEKQASVSDADQSLVIIKTPEKAVVTANQAQQVEVYQSHLPLVKEKEDIEVVPAVIEAQPEKAPPTSKYDEVISALHLDPSLKSELEFLIPNIPREFELSIKPNSPKGTFYNGEKISFNVSSGRDCYIAVIVMQADESVVVLYPNRYTPTSLVKAGQQVQVPAEDSSEVYIEVAPPFGADLIQVIACTEQSELHQFISDMKPNAGDFKVVTRGLVLKKVQSAQAVQVSNNQRLWSTAHTIIITKERAP